MMDIFHYFLIFNTFNNVDTICITTACVHLQMLSLLNIAGSISRFPQHVMVFNEPPNVTLHVICCSPVAQKKTWHSIIHLSQERPSGSSQLTLGRRSLGESVQGGVRENKRESEGERVSTREELEHLSKEQGVSEGGKWDVMSSKVKKTLMGMNTVQ